MYLGSNVSSTENEISMRLVKVWSVLERLLIMWMSEPSDRIKRNFSMLRSCPFYYMETPRGR